MAVILKANGEQVLVHPNNNNDFSLEELREIVGGHIEIIRLPDFYMVVNEEGKLINLPLNEEATQIYQCGTKELDYIVGDVLICSIGQIL